MNIHNNFYIQCTCGEDLLFSTTDQVRICDCRKVVELSTDVKRYFETKYGHLDWA